MVRDRIATAELRDDLLADAVEHGVRQLVVQVRGRGDAWYASTLEPRAEALADDGSDPLAHLVATGALLGVRSHAWLNVHLVWSSPGAAPRDPSHLVRAHPDWLLRADPAAGAPEAVRALDPAGGPDRPGVYLDPASAPGREHTVNVATDIARRYRVEGLHWDYARYPQARLAGSVDGAREVTAFVRAAADAVRRTSPRAVLSAAVFPDPATARDAVLQRWPEWAADGLVDLLCPMAYRRDTAAVARLLATARAAAPRTRLWGGLMGYAGEPALLAAQVRAARAEGCEGAILFAYDPARRDLLEAFSSA